ncbi:uncharacterized protein THITE_2058850 [Thermothielavioides terrestris NRRL 8126]|uniref:Alcohol dehydrogenase-like C-terminal domain-containing protein n=1 Tax=Thermothielavioides terrestris (strain ATCC 38088 / NRRL 8126) TaxID=578455 RepID=G2RHS2_THETT|nr:uncharacterized protein THITE_2058850 [Thermothielavioides terrestris NRRL 8126]AEO71384.1 hypothetical protein THITE_2058850 [Thermothielavioides terrestris NRRL 8126]
MDRLYSGSRHGLDKICPLLKSSVLVFGAGPTGMLAQLLPHSGCSQVTIAVPSGSKTDVAKQLDAADTYTELSRSDLGA